MKWRFINSDIRGWPFAKIILGAIAGCLLTYYCAALNLGALELLRFMAGALALWIPLGGWLYVLLRNEVPDRISRIAFSAGSSYALTTLFYFGAATLHCSWLFYFAQIAAVAGLIFYAIKNKAIVTKDLRSFSHFDWVLAALVAASMVANIPAQSAWRRDAQAGGMIFDGAPDQLFHVGLAYELSRHIPPRQTMMRSSSAAIDFEHVHQPPCIGWCGAFLNFEAFQANTKSFGVWSRHVRTASSDGVR